MPESCVAVTLPPGIIQHSNCTQCLCCLFRLILEFAEGSTLAMISRAAEITEWEVDAGVLKY